jgi:hypothetical protein
LGGLGNQMFQYALGKSLSLARNEHLKLDISEFIEYKLRKYELGFFNIEEHFATNEECQQMKEINFYREKYFHFDSNVEILKGDAYLFGYWQSEKYFKEIRDILLKEFSLKNELHYETKQYQDEIDQSVSVSLHVRRGDYISNPITNAYHGVCDLEYYKKAVKLILSIHENARFFIFSDDLGWVKTNFSFISNVNFIDLNHQDHDKEEMYLMSKCQHNIIANSSFSWWGAWMNTNPRKIVITPRKWFTDETINTGDRIPSTWLRI